MENCLKTQLKANVINDSLVKLGMAQFSVGDVPDAHFRFYLESTKVGVMEIIGDAYFTDSTYTQNLGKTAELKIPYTNYYIAGQNYKVQFDKYDIVTIGVNSTEFTIDVEQFGYSDSLLTIGLSQGNCIGDASKLLNMGNIIWLELKGAVSFTTPQLANNTNVTRVNISGCVNATGVMQALSPLTELTYLNIVSTGLITGSIESLVEGMSINRTSGSLQFRKSDYDPITFHDKQSSVINVCTISFNATGADIIDSEEQTIASYNKTTGVWAYNS